MISPANDWRYQKGTAPDPFMGIKGTPGHYSYLGLKNMDLQCFKNGAIILSLPEKFTAERVSVRFGVYYKSTGKVDDNNNPITNLQPDYSTTIEAVKMNKNKDYGMIDSTLVNLISTNAGVTRYVVSEQGEKSVVGAFPNPAEYIQSHNQKSQGDADADNSGNITPQTAPNNGDNINNGSETEPDDKDSVYTKVD